MRFKEMVLVGILMLGFSSEALAQDTIKPVMKSKKVSVSKISKAADDLKESLNSNDELGIAKNY